MVDAVFYARLTSKIKIDLTTGGTSGKQKLRNYIFDSFDKVVKFNKFALSSYVLSFASLDIVNITLSDEIYITDMCAKDGVFYLAFAYSMFDADGNKIYKSFELPCLIPDDNIIVDTLPYKNLSVLTQRDSATFEATVFAAKIRIYISSNVFDLKEFTVPAWVSDKKNIFKFVSDYKKQTFAIAFQDNIYNGLLPDTGYIFNTRETGFNNVHFFDKQGVYITTLRIEDKAIFIAPNSTIKDNTFLVYPKVNASGDLIIAPEYYFYTTTETVYYNVGEGYPIIEVPKTVNHCRTNIEYFGFSEIAYSDDTLNYIWNNYFYDDLSKKYSISQLLKPLDDTETTEKIDLKAKIKPIDTEKIKKQAESKALDKLKEDYDLKYQSAQKKAVGLTSANADVPVIKN